MRASFRRWRQRVIRYWRLNAVVPRLLRFNAYTGYVGRRLFQYVPFLLPHDRSYYGFRHLVKAGDGLFLDVGANDGISAIGFKHIHSDYRVLSLEPNRWHEASLKRLKKKLKGFDYRIVGAGQETCRQDLHMPFYQGVPIYTAASLYKDYVDVSMRRQFAQHAGHKVEYVTQSVEIVRLDDWALTPDIIKIDTEGFEYEVLLGLSRTIARCRPFIMLEYNPDLLRQQDDFLRPLGYEMFIYVFKEDRFHPFSMARPQLDGTRVAENIFCIPSEKKQGLPIRTSPCP